METSKKKGLRIHFNAPGTLCFVALCTLVCLINQLIPDGKVNQAAFSVYRTSWSDPMQYLRLLTHVIGHADWDHLLGNMMYLLLLGPMLEDRYGTADVIFVLVITAVITGLINVLFFPTTALLGASGVVFAFILLSSTVGMREHTIPFTLILVALLFIGKEIYNAIATQNNISEMAHIVGGFVGGAMGFVLNKFGAGRKRPDRPVQG